MSKICCINSGLANCSRSAESRIRAADSSFFQQNRMMGRPSQGSVGGPPRLVFAAARSISSVQSCQNLSEFSVAPSPGARCHMSSISKAVLPPSLIIGSYHEKKSRERQLDCGTEAQG